MSKIPSQIMDFRLYNDNSQVIGVGEEITLPTISMINKTLTTPGGEVDMPSLATENMELEIPFNIFNNEAAETVHVGEVGSYVIRGAAQSANNSTHELTYDGLVVTAKGFTTEVALGSVKRADGMNSTIKMNLTYLKVASYSGTIFLEIDKLNGVFKVNGTDQRSKISAYL